MIDIKALDIKVTDIVIFIVIHHKFIAHTRGINNIKAAIFLLTQKRKGKQQ